MPRNNQGVYQLPLGSKAVPSTTIASAPYNTLQDDLAADANAVRPISAGGTGANSAESARAALGVPDGATFVKRAGDRMTGALSSAVKAHGSPGTATEEFKYADGNTHSVTVTGPLVINPTGLSEGDVMQVNVLFQSGSISVSGTTQWELGGGVKSSNIADLGIALTAGAAYRLIFEIVGGVRTGLFQ